MGVGLGTGVIGVSMGGEVITTTGGSAFTYPHLAVPSELGRKVVLNQLTTDPGPQAFARARAVLWHTSTLGTSIFSVLVDAPLTQTACAP